MENTLSSPIRLDVPVITLDPSQYRDVYKVPLYNLPYWPQTMEGCLLTGELGKAVRDVFYSMPEPIQHALTFSPESGWWTARAKLWQTVLKLTLPPRQYYTAINKIIRWYVHCVRDVREEYKYRLSDKQIYEKEIRQFLCEVYRMGAAGEPRPFEKDFETELKGVSEKTNIPLEQLENNRGIKRMFELGNKVYEDGAKLGRPLLQGG